ncbi:hypothetical protein NDN08_007535 [Rhodosorus marinus]|uniref:Pseudouridine synthase I TruA alpha/beta domain-containing protein n=1 Tax=Rhodosorus marinus TaxID=101924 RepID=A0AAV8V0P3_9RHOD|nr:hypothetical protein NDN08_007535 [Rhodosorus marinus]
MMELTNTEDDKGEIQAPKPKKRRVVLFMGYLGSGYQGMQRNRGAKTIEGELMRALVKTACVPEHLQDNYAKLKWSRSARTDKGVSAAGQVVSADLKCEVDGELSQDLLDQINESLPKDLTVYGWMRATGSFSAKSDCVRRRYEYLLPTSGLGEDEVDNDKVVHDRLARFNVILARYLGSHLFHNFTDKMKGDDPTAQRYILECTCSEPFTIENNSFLKVSLVGQSFVLHQIRKMVGLALQVFWSGLPPETLDLFMSPEKELQTPTAPAPGLLLAECFFIFYNRRYQKELRKPIALDHFREAAEDFKRSRIYSFIASEEARTSSMKRWISLLPESIPLDTGTIIGDVEMLSNAKREAEERRKRRLESLYPVFEDLDSVFQVQDVAELEQRKNTVLQVKQRFDREFGYSPSSIVRVPGSVILIGDWLELLELPCIGFALPDGVLTAVAKSSDSENVRVNHSNEELADAVLRPNGCRMASAEDSTKVEWSRMFSLGWQCGVTGKGMRPKMLPAARVMIGGELGARDNELGVDSAYLLAALLTFMDLHAWKMPRLEMAKMCFGWEKQGRGSATGLMKYLCSLEGKHNQLLLASIAPKLSTSNVTLPSMISLVMIRLGSLSHAEVERRKKTRDRVKAEISVTLRIITARSGRGEGPQKSLAQLIQYKPSGTLEACGIVPDEVVSLDAAMVELGIELEAMERQEPGINDLQEIRLGLVTISAAMEAQCIGRVYSILEKSEDLSGLELMEIGKLLNDSETIRSKLESTSDEATQVVQMCIEKGALSARLSSVFVDVNTSYVLCTVKSESVAAFCRSLEDESASIMDGLSIAPVVPGMGASVWEFMKKPVPKHKRKKQ